jgi:hypothetical protein
VDAMGWDGDGGSVAKVLQFDWEFRDQTLEFSKKIRHYGLNGVAPPEPSIITFYTKRSYLFLLMRNRMDPSIVCL